MSIKINKADTSNIEQISILFNQYRIFYKQKDNVKLAKEFISQRIKNNESTIFYAIDEENNYLGFIQIYPTFSSVNVKKSLILNDLFVDEKARNKGVAKLLMNEAKKYCIEIDANGLALETAKDNINAQKLYKNLGYKKSENYYSYFLDA